MIPLCTPDLGSAERALLLEALDSTFVSSVGPFVERFEREFAGFTGARQAVACASGTAALHLALRVCGVGRGDLVLVSDFTFIASATPIIHQGAEPVFIDSEERTWNLDPQAVEDAFVRLDRSGRRPKAVIAVHVLGAPADLAPIQAICQRFGAILIEDAAEALGATIGAAHVGTIGRIGCFSFNGNKVITTGGGGMCVTADPALATAMKHLSTQAKLPGLAFVHDQVGYNYRLTNLAAALGLAQLGRLPEFLRRKRAIAERYRTALEPLGCRFQGVHDGARSSDWLASCLVAGDRDRILAHLTAAGIGGRPLWMPLSDQPCFLEDSRGRDGGKFGEEPRFMRFGGEVAKRLSATGISLPSSTHLSVADQDHVITTLIHAMGQS